MNDIVLLETAPDIAYFLDHRGMVQLISTCGVTQPIFGVSDRLIFAPIALGIDRPIFRPISRIAKKDSLFLGCPPAWICPATSAQFCDHLKAKNGRVRPPTTWWAFSQIQHAGCRSMRHRTKVFQNPHKHTLCHCLEYTGMVRQNDNGIFLAFAGFRETVTAPIF
jgi:hypothetical protein